MLADPFLGNRDGATETPLVKRTRQGWPWFDRMTAFLRSDWLRRVTGWLRRGLALSSVFNGNLPRNLWRRKVSHEKSKFISSPPSMHVAIRWPRSSKTAMVRYRPPQSCRFSFLTRGGCIDFSVEAFWLTCVGRFHLRAQAMTLREVGLSNFSIQASGKMRLGDHTESPKSGVTCSQCRA